MSRKYDQSDGQRRFWDEAAFWRAAPEQPQFFWRDDDLAKRSPNLEWCLELAEGRQIAIAFAAIPTLLTQPAADLIRRSRLSRIAVHGYRHQNHALGGQDANEYPAEREAGVVLSELRRGIELIRHKARDRYLGMFVPPWGRFHQGFSALLERAGHACISGGARAPKYSVALQHDCQIAAEQGRNPLSVQRVLGEVARQLELRRCGKIAPSIPIGLMTHHVTFDGPIVAVLEQLLDIIREAGFTFSTFSEVDAIATRVTPPVASSYFTISSPKLDSNAALEVLSARTLPTADESSPQLVKLLTMLANVSPIALLRFAHLQDFARRQARHAEVLSVGCGKAIAEVALALMHPEQQWLAVDVDPARFAPMAALVAEMQLSNIRFQQLDVEQLPFDATGPLRIGSFDAITVVEVLMYLDDPTAVVSALGSLLRPGGELSCIEAFLPNEEDAQTLAKLRAHTRSRQGGFSHRRLGSFVESARCLALVRQYNCYYAQSQELVATLWRQLARTDDAAFIDLAFATARLDLAGALTESRRAATAVAFVARAK